MRAAWRCGPCGGQGVRGGIRGEDRPTARLQAFAQSAGSAETDL